jgi:peptide/nickel transport system ATP-binding protein
MSAPLLDVKNLHVRFRLGGQWRAAVDDLSFEVGFRETLAIVGESGSGKSVTALSILRLLGARGVETSGSILLEGVDLLGLSPERIRAVRGAEIAMIFQEPMTSFNPVMTIGRQIGEALKFHRGFGGRAAEAEALRLLERVRVPAARARLNQYPHNFSGGMRQRAMIAMALACKPKLLIADEPTTALDVTVQAEILELVKQLQNEDGMSVVFITHDMGVVAEIADRAIVMLRGRKVEENFVSGLLAAPVHPYTTALLAAAPRLGARRGEATTEVASGARPLLEVRDLSVRFPMRAGLLGLRRAEIRAVESVSFDLEAGETLALVGESGCGKSTTGRAILRLVEPSGGEIRFEGRNVAALSASDLRALRPHMQMIFQDPFASLNPRLRVGEAIAEPLIAHRMNTARDARERVADLLRKVELSPDMAGRFPHEFSGGQRQRLAIARALAMSPRLIVADEAVSALDVSVKARIVELMMRLQQELGVAYLFISHDIAIVERVSHRIAVMWRGEIVEIGPRAAILEDARHPYTKRLIAAAPTLDPARRNFRLTADSAEPLSPIRPIGYQPPARRFVEVGRAHFVAEAAD